MTSSVPTYVLHGAAFVNVQGDEHIRATPGQSLAQAVESIRTPANIILAAHGQPEGTFLWNLEEKLPYADLLRALPREGVHSVTITSCYGAMALSDENLRASPPGAIIQTIVSESSKGIFGFTKRLGDESQNVTRPMDKFIVALDNFDPEDYERQIRYLNETYHENSDPSPDHALPHVIGIGGSNPQRIDLDDKVAELATAGAALTRNEDWAYSVRHVQSLFDTVNLRMNPEAPDEQMMSGGDEQALDDAIAAVAKKIERGERPANVEERRIAYALSAAYLDTSSQLAQCQATAMGLDAWQGDHRMDDATLFNAVKTGPLGSQKDGTVTLKELQVALLKQGVMSLGEVDADHDHNVTAAEISAALRKDSEKSR